MAAIRAMRSLSSTLFRSSSHQVVLAPRAICSSTRQLSMDDVNQLFGEARLCLQDAIESKGTVYFVEDFEEAKRMTNETLDAFDALCQKATPDEKQSLLEANRPKMAQLREEFNMLQDELIHDD